MKDPTPAPARRFVDQVVLVTGAGGGIGSAVAERFAVEGAYVVVADVDEGRAQTVTSGITEAGDRAETLAFDLVDPTVASGRSPHTTGATIDITGADYVR